MRRTEAAVVVQEADRHDDRIDHRLRQPPPLRTSPRPGSAPGLVLGRGRHGELVRGAARRPRRLVSSEGARTEFIGKISSRGLALSALTANGNQLHPTSGKQQDQVVHDTIEVASALGVPTVVLMSGLPGAHGDSSPNWVTTSWPPENLEILDY